MSLPMKVQADVLQVLPPAVPTDYTSIIVNAVAVVIGTVLGVFLGYCLSVRERKLLEHKSSYQELVTSANYAIGVLGAIENSLLMSSKTVLRCIDELISTGEFLSFGEIHTLKADYTLLSKSLVDFPTLIVDVSAIEAGVVSYNGAIKSYSNFVQEENVCFYQCVLRYKNMLKCLSHLVENIDVAISDVYNRAVTIKEQRGINGKDLFFKISDQKNKLELLEEINQKLKLVLLMETLMNREFQHYYTLNNEKASHQ